MLAVLPKHVLRPRYDRTDQAIGIVHFGIGAFHRAHQAVYTDDAMNAGDRDWSIVGVSLRAPEVSMQLNPQDGLYSIVERSTGASRIRVVGAVKGVLVAATDSEKIAATIASPNTHVLSFTITEKGYGRTPDGGLDVALPAIANDLAGGAACSIYGHLEAGLARRRRAGLSGVTLLSCDNIAQNGATLNHLLVTFLRERDPSLAAWFSDTCRTPCTMVDRIVPATTAADQEALTAEYGIEDAAMVVTEPFRQWVVEDHFAGSRPQWEAGGAQVTSNIEPFETAKLRILNGAHSALAYLGLERGHAFVHEAIGDPELRSVIEQVMQEAITTLKPHPADLPSYARAVLGRLNNSALPYRLDQIAKDGSQKIPQRWLKTLSERRHDSASPGILCALAAWIRYARALSIEQDPLASRLRALWMEAGEYGIARALFAGDGLFARDWIASNHEIALLTHAITNSND